MPRKVFVAGEILTASDVNTNLMDQSVMVFDDATDRATAIPTPVEGMVTYLKDDEAVTFFDGDAFRVVGGLIAVKSAIRDTPEVFSNVGIGANVAVGGLEIVHEVADPANRLIISVFLGSAASSQGRGSVGVAIDDGTGLINIGVATGSRTSVTAGGRTVADGSNTQNHSLAVTLLHTPGAGSKTYTVRAINVGSAVETIFVNRSELDIDTPALQRAVSSVVIQEVAV